MFFILFSLIFRFFKETFLLHFFLYKDMWEFLSQTNSSIFFYLQKHSIIWIIDVQRHLREIFYILVMLAAILLMM